MTGIKFDFEAADIIIGADGTFVVTETSSQCCALIAISQICRLTKPELGAYIGSRTLNVKHASVDAILAEAKRMVENDGGRDVGLRLIDEKLLFTATYDN